MGGFILLLKGPPTFWRGTRLTAPIFIEPVFSHPAQFGDPDSGSTAFKLQIRAKGSSPPAAATPVQAFRRRALLTHPDKGGRASAGELLLLLLFFFFLVGGAGFIFVLLFCSSFSFFCFGGDLFNVFCFCYFLEGVNTFIFLVGGEEMCLFVRFSFFFGGGVFFLGGRAQMADMAGKEHFFGPEEVVFGFKWRKVSFKPVTREGCLKLLCPLRYPQRCSHKDPFGSTEAAKFPYLGFWVP